jgi:hypothetical protein
MFYQKKNKQNDTIDKKNYCYYYKPTVKKLQRNSLKLNLLLPLFMSVKKLERGGVIDKYVALLNKLR